MESATFADTRIGKPRKSVEISVEFRIWHSLSSPRPGRVANVKSTPLERDVLAAPCSAHEFRYQFDMRRVAKLVDRAHAFDSVSAVDQDARIAREGRDIAGHRDDRADLARRQ